MRIFLEYRAKKFWLEVRSCNWFKRFLGLMFIRSEKARALLLFDFKKPRRMKIHSFFCPKFLAVWLDKKNKIVDLRIVKPFKLMVCSKKSFTKLIEIPVNKKYEEVIKLLCS